jgi:histone-lysine N-methyltransferase SETD2
LKRFAKEISKKMVSSDYKHNRVEDPTNITERHEKKVKGTVKEFFDKAVVKRVAHEKKKAEKLKEAGERAKIEGSADAPATLDAASPDVDDKAEMSDVDFNEEDVAEPPSITTPSVGADCDDSLKRKRDDADEDSMKRLKSGDTPEEEAIVATPPPPPPPSDVPPALEDVDMVDEAQRMEEEELRIQQEELERENEEAERLEQEEQRKGLDGAEAAGNLNVAAASSIGIVNGAEQSTGFLEDPGMAVHTEEGVLSH